MQEAAEGGGKPVMTKTKWTEEEREEIRQAAKTLVRLWPFPSEEGWFECEVSWADVYAKFQRLAETGEP